MCFNISIENGQVTRINSLNKITQTTLINDRQIKQLISINGIVGIKSQFFVSCGSTSI